MSESNQFYADNEKSAEGQEKDVDLSLAYEIKSKSTPEEEWEDQPIVYFCHDCGKRVATKKEANRIKFTCQECGGGRISFGTERSVEGYFHLNEEGVRKK